MKVSATRVGGFIIVLLLLPITYAESAIELGEVVKLGDSDMGLLDSTIDPMGKDVLAFGMESNIILIDSNRPEENINLTWNGDTNIHDADYHPGGKTAILVGEKGVVLRYTKENNDINRVGNYLQFSNNNLKSVAWNADGSWAYIGSEEGNIWRFRSNGMNNSEVYLLSESIFSEVSSIECHNEINICIISTIYDGIGIIDSAHEVHMIGGVNYPWLDVSCPQGNSCVAISNEMNIGLIELNLNNARNSSLTITHLDGVTGQMRTINYQDSSRCLISVVPFALIEYNTTTKKAFLWLENSDIKEFNPSISDERIITTWTTGENSGWILTSQGTAIKYNSKTINENNRFVEAIIATMTVIVAIGIILWIIVNLAPRFNDRLEKTFSKGKKQKKVGNTQKGRNNKR